MRGRWVLCLAIAAGCGQKSPEPPSSESEKPSPIATRQPALDAAAHTNLAFEDQTRDAEWATATEREIKRRYDKIRGAKLVDTECRHDRCRMDLVGSTGDVGRAIEDLEGPRGFHGFAATISLTAPTRNSDGTVALRVFAAFDRR